MIKQNAEWYETIKPVKTGLRLMGIISLDNHNPKQFFARIFLLDENYYITGMGSFGSFGYAEKRPKYLKALRAVRSWSNLVDTDYFDTALDNYIYVNDPEHGSPTMADALKKLRVAMNELAKKYR